MGTYTLARPRSTVIHVVGGTSMFRIAVNSMVAGTLGALVADASGAGTAGVAVVGALVGLVYLGAMLMLGYRLFARGPYLQPHFPTTAP